MKKTMCNTINHFVPGAPFLYPLKTLENYKVSRCFQLGGRNRVNLELMD